MQPKKILLSFVLLFLLCSFSIGTEVANGADLGKTAWGGGMPDVDFRIASIRYNSSQDMFFVMVENTTGDPFDDEVAFGIEIDGSRKMDRSKPLYFLDNDAFEVFLFSSSEFLDQAGTVNVVITVDVNNAVNEEDESNNTWSGAYSVNPSATAIHDLELINITTAETDKAELVIKNSSPNPFDGSVVVSWAVNEVPQPDHSFDLTIHPGHSENVRLPYTLVPGRNPIFAKIDPDNQIRETNEDNNRLLKYLYPDIDAIGLMKFARIGWETKKRIVTRTTTDEPLLITPDTIGPNAPGGTNRYMHATVYLRGLGSYPVPVYRVFISVFTEGNHNSGVAAVYHTGPVNGEIFRPTIQFWVPRSAASGNKNGMIKISLKYNNVIQDSWEIPIKYQEF